MKHIDMLQIILERIEQAEDDYYEFRNSFGYAMAVRDLARIMGLDPSNYGLNNK